MQAWADLMSAGSLAVAGVRERVDLRLARNQGFKILDLGGVATYGKEILGYLDF